MLKSFISDKVSQFCYVPFGSSGQGIYSQSDLNSVLMMKTDMGKIRTVFCFKKHVRNILLPGLEEQARRWERHSLFQLCFWLNSFCSCYSPQKVQSSLAYIGQKVTHQSTCWGDQILKKATVVFRVKTRLFNIQAYCLYYPDYSPCSGIGIWIIAKPFFQLLSEYHRY